MHRRWKCIGIVAALGCMTGCPRVAGLVGGNPDLLAAFGAAASNAAAGGLNVAGAAGGNALLQGGGLTGGGGPNAAAGAAGIPNFVVPFEQGPVPAQPGVIAGSGRGP